MSRPLPTRLVARCLTIACCVSAALPCWAQPSGLPGDADEVFYVLEVNEFEFGEQPPTAAQLRDLQFFPPEGQPRAVVEGGEAYFLGHGRSSATFGGLDTVDRRLGFVVPRLAVRVSGDQPVRGKLFMPSDEARSRSSRTAGRDKDSPAEGRVLTFTIPADVKPVQRETYLRAELAYWSALRDSEFPGTAWYRHQARSLRQALDDAVEDDDEDQTARQRRRWLSQWDRSFALISGGQALSENLQLDRPLPELVDGRGDAPVDVDSLTGITTAEIDWEPLIADADPEPDPLARFVPADQHAIFFSSFSNLVAALDLAEHHGRLLLDLGQQQPGQTAMSRSRYEKQLGLHINPLVKLLGPQLVASAALTGGDLYFRTGTDLALLLQADDAETLQALIVAQLLRSATEQPAKPVEGQAAGLSYRGLVSPDRTICSYVATIADVVVVTNSLTQLERLAMVSRDQGESLAELPEYTFFRQRYARDKDNEIALAIISDATIRRWCGPRWRIATSRRTQGAAVISQLQAQHLKSLVRGSVEPVELQADAAIAEAGFKAWLHPSGVRSPRYGSLSFQTPIQELKFQQVTAAEAQAYRRWRIGYERNWRQVFDPIALQLSRHGDALAIDLTVMPLIGTTEYRRLIEISAGGELKPTAGDLHAGTLAHGALALNKQSRQLQRYLRMTETMVPQLRGNPLSWLGDTVAWYLDDGPFWKELAEAEQAETFLRENFRRLPLALYVDVDDGVKLTAVLVGLRMFVEQVAPGMTIWETKQHDGVDYVKISPSDGARGIVADESDDVAIYYAASGTALLVSINERTLLAAIERQNQRAEAPKAGRAIDFGGRPWLGNNVGLQVDQRVVDVALGTWYSQHLYQRRLVSWRNLTILNQWQKRFSDRDPVELQATYFNTKLVCPGGGRYVWNERWQTIESTAFGHPGQPRMPDVPLPILGDFHHAQFGLTFEHDGLRANVRLDR